MSSCWPLRGKVQSPGGLVVVEEPVHGASTRYGSGREAPDGLRPAGTAATGTCVPQCVRVIARTRLEDRLKAQHSDARSTGSPPLGQVPPSSPSLSPFAPHHHRNQSSRYLLSLPLFSSSSLSSSPSTPPLSLCPPHPHPKHLSALTPVSISDPVSRIVGDS